MREMSLLKFRRVLLPKRFSAFSTSGKTFKSAVGINVRNSLPPKRDYKMDSGCDLTWYSCGPTVYDAAHLGHARTYVCTDIIRRILMDNFSINLKFAMGITDIDDKIIAKGIASGYKSWDDMKAMTRQLENDFFFDMDRLNVLRPDAVLRVTEHIDEIITYVQRLIDLGHAYVSEDGVYFSVMSFRGGDVDVFGRHVVPSSSSASAIATPVGDDTTEEGLTPEPIVHDAPSHHKRDQRDFALWKLPRKAQDQQQSADLASQPCWDSPWGLGRPGWHIECSAMTHAYFGPSIDVHSGGVDLQFPHHNNEVLQCEAHNCCDAHITPGGAKEDWVKLWLHTGHLYIEGRKMSKSLKNFVSIQEYFDARHSANPADDFRLFCLQHKYSSSLSYTTERIAEAAQYRNKIDSYLNYIKTLASAHHNCEASIMSSTSSGLVRSSKKSTAESAALERALLSTRTEVQRALADDFDTPKVLRLLSELVNEAAGYAVLSMTTLSASKEIKQTSGVAAVVHHPIEPLVSTAVYLTKILTTLGLRFPGNTNLNRVMTAPYIAASGAHSVDSFSGGESDAGVSSDAIDKVLEFRSAVRQVAVQGSKTAKKLSKESPAADYKGVLEDLLRLLLQQCDEGRTSLGSALGVQIDDVGASSKWRAIK